MTKSEKILMTVKDGYNQIAEHFSNTRYNPWQEFELFKQYIKPGQKILDLGCGNGRLYKYLKEQGINVDYYGLDNSENLIKICKEKYPEIADRFSVSEITKLPYADEFFDLVICIATFHHLPSKKLRLKTLNEVRRVLKLDSYFLMTNWYWQHWHLWKKFFTNFFQKNSLMDFFFPWKSSDGVEQCLRYYHIFTKKELRRLLKKVNFEIIKIFPNLKLDKNKRKRGINVISIVKKI